MLSVVRSATLTMSNPKKTMQNALFQCLDRLGRSVHKTLQDKNDPTKVQETPNLFVPVDFFKGCMRTSLQFFSQRSFMLNRNFVCVHCNRSKLNEVMQEGHLRAEWETVNTRVLSTSAHPFNIRCNPRQGNLKCIFVANARKRDGTLVVQCDQRLGNA